MCNLIAHTFELSGPATNGLYVNVDDPDISRWASSLSADLTITIEDPSDVDYDGRYSVRHNNGKSSELSELLICHIKQPQFIFTSGMYESSFEIVKQSQESLTIELEPYLLTEDAECGSVVYEASVVSGYNPFAAGYAYASSNILQFDSVSEYEAGVMTVQVSIKSSVHPQYLDESIAFDIHVIGVSDCNVEETTSLTADPPICTALPTACESAELAFNE